MPAAVSNSGSAGAGAGAAGEGTGATDTAAVLTGADGPLVTTLDFCSVTSLTVVDPVEIASGAGVKESGVFVFSSTVDAVSSTVAAFRFKALRFSLIPALLDSLRGALVSSFGVALAVQYPPSAMTATPSLMLFQFIVFDCVGAVFLKKVP